MARFRQRLFCVLCILILTLTCVLIHEVLQEPTKYVEWIRENRSHLVSRACIRPELKLDDPVMKKWFIKYELPTCEGTKDWIYIENGTVKYSPEVLKKNVSVTCRYFPLIRDGDEKYHWGKPGLDIADGLPLSSDFFKVSCKNGLGDYYEGIHAGVSYRKERANRPEPPLSSGFNGLGIAVLGFDSMSRMSWLRRLPKTRQYFHDHLGAIELEGHNIVGDGTTAAFLPMLTGQFEWELPECRKNEKGAVTLDDFPFIWHDMKKAGYLTSFCEGVGGTFNYRMVGFKNQPTDYYTRTFYRAARHFMKNSTKYCIGSQTQSQIWLSHLKDIFMMYKTKRKFLFHALTEMSHDDNNPITMMDEDIVDLLKFLHNNDYLNNTLLILLSDHGVRFGALRKLWTGKLEERLPYVAFLFPKWFEKKYPKAIRNLRINSKRLTTPFDVYETFKDFLHFKGDGIGNTSKRGISLFQKIPLERSCEMADIAPHWCTCLTWKDADLEDDETAGAVKAAIAGINNITASNRDDCAFLAVRHVTSAQKLEARKEFLKFKKTDGVGGIYNVKLTANTENRLTLYQLELVTEPGDGRFELTVTFDRAENKFHVSEKEISRTDTYGNGPYCILKKNYKLKPYCYCKK